MYFRYNVESGWHEKTAKIRGTEYLLQVNQESWNDMTSKSISRWLRSVNKNLDIPLHFRWGRMCDPQRANQIKETEDETIHPIKTETQASIAPISVPSTVCTTEKWCCAGCGRSYETRSGLWKHENSCDSFKRWLTESKILVSFNENEDTKNIVGLVEAYSSQTSHSSSSTHNQSTVTQGQGSSLGPTGPTQINNIQNNQNITNQTIHINIRDFGKENPNWLTVNTLYKVIGNVDRAIPMLMQTKHFNEQFPENMNLRVNTKGDVNHRLQVREGGKWRIRDSKQTFYKVVIDMYEILSDALNEEDEVEAEGETDEIADSSHPEVSRAKRSAKFMDKVKMIRPLWEGFKTKMDELHDPELMTELWEDLKTFLLDRKLCIEQETD